jgi:protein-S-isoprenylcysteine O-methyltransferase Ste14
MTEVALHRYLALGLIAVGLGTFVVLLRITAPYGRHGRPGWGPTLPNRAGWIVMECPAVLVFGVVYLMGANRFAAAPLVLLALWQWHYLNRTFVFPFRLPRTDRRMPLVVVAMGMAFNCLNGYLNARWLSALGDYAHWLTDPRLVLGAAIFALGWVVNTRSDRILLALRRPGETGYRVPHGGLFRWVSCPNYLGEIVEWTGWAVASSSLAGVAFLVFTAANLVPRALANHRFYRERLADYPPGRKAVLPFVW